ncbi:hypothetical protein ZYGR_0AD04050 [Zygosaccharomyces rouxii]|uniref:mRNA 5'-phosphatase n=1 Tax=Zygosaccharomyces rouxii TaxID=4956 RepID=A0A1Q3A690_ZYGRO|nr:hypothetical protein ZYGR_0AD04050 [Zygosaccharomyces rouxii]
MSISFATKSIILKGQPVKIILPNAKSPGALAALANTLLLNPNQTENDRIKKLLKLVQRNYVIERDLEQALASIGSKCSDGEILVDELGKKLAEINIHNSHGANSRVRQLAQVLPSLNDVDPVFDGTFKDASKTDIFHLYGVNLLHGWIIDSKEHPQTYEKISKLSYKEAQNEIKSKGSMTNHINCFFDRSDTQLTEKGLEHLRTSVKEGSFAILFRYDRFYTLHKEKGELLYLVVDKDLPGVVWHSLRSVDGVNDTFYSGDFKAVDDDLTKNVQDWIDTTIASVYEPYRSKIEVEMKYGIMIDPKTKKRVTLPTSIPTIYRGRVKMKPNVDKEVFQEFKEYMKFAYEGRGISSATQDSLYRVNIGFQKTRFLRKSIDLQTRAVEEIIEKKPVASLFIHRPKDSYDMKLSINLELPIVKKGILKNCKRPINIRQKHRISYFKDHSDCRIDITDVQRKTNDTRVDNGEKVETTREIEVEMFAPDLLLGWEVKNEESFLFNQFVRILLNTTSTINEELTYLSKNLGNQ